MNLAKTFEEAQFQKAARLQDLARRAAELDPPIPFDVLRHTPAYQVAQHIARPLDDFEWSTLRVCLEAQRPQAEIFAAVSPQSSDSGIMSKKRKNRRSKAQRTRTNAGPAALSATGANSLPTGGADASGIAKTVHVAPQRPAAVAPTSTAPQAATMSRAIFNQQSQRVPPTTGQTFDALGAAVQQLSPWRAALASNTASTSAAGPSTAASTTGLFFGAVGPSSAPSQTTAPTSTVPSVSTVGPLSSTSRPARPAPELAQVSTTTIDKSPPVVVAVNPIASHSESRQHSSHREAIKIESNEPEPYRPSRPEYRNHHVYRPETEAIRQPEHDHRPRLVATQYHDHLRPRSRSPPSERRRLVNAYRERDYLETRRHISEAYPPATIAHVAPIRGGHDNYYDYPAQPPVARYVPNVLYDKYGNEYVRTAPREPDPYVLYPPPPARGY
jgi:hypothetical protein